MSSVADGGASLAEEVRDNPARHRFEIWVGGELAGFTTYKVDGDEYSLIHTETQPAFAGHGVASRLVAAILTELRSRGARVLPYCPFVAGYLRRHPAETDLVPRERWADFDIR